jgi:hypothetical protein
MFHHGKLLLWWGETAVKAGRFYAGVSTAQGDT